MSDDKPDVKNADRMRLNPDPLGTVAGEDERFVSSLLAWNRTATRADRLRVWLATGGTKEEFDADHPEAPDAREHVIDGGIPTAALTVTRLHMDAPGDWDWL